MLLRNDDTLARPELQAVESALRQVEPAVVLAPAWLMHAVIAYDRRLLPAGLSVPDEQLYILPKSRFQQFIRDRDLPPPGNLPESRTLILLERPDGELQADDSDTLLRYWRLLTRARAEANVRLAYPALEAESVRGLSASVTDAGVTGPPLDAIRRDYHRLREQIARLTPSLLNEARSVLSRENRIASSASDFEVYAKFAAAWTELYHFTPALLPHVFPSVFDAEEVSRVVAADVGPNVVSSLRPPGVVELPETALQALDSPRSWHVWFRRRGSVRRKRMGRHERARIRQQQEDRKDELLAAADKAAAVGNSVRATVLRARAYRTDRDQFVVPTAAVADLNVLADRIAAALSLPSEANEEWREGLRPLLDRASRSFWSPERRLLYDLQKVCIDHEREIYSTNVVEWLLGFCRRPLFRSLPKQRLALAARRFQEAIDRLAVCEMAFAHRERLDQLLHGAAHQAEHQLRVTLRPALDQAMDDVRLRPRNLVESVARDKLAEELIDAVVRDGYLTFGGVRDAISRNAIRCRDLRTFSEWLGYDQLLKLDLRLGDALDGVYRRGEIYRYAFQKVSSLLFANPVGRLLTRTVILPIAGAYLILEAFQHTVGLLIHKIFRVHVHLLPVWKVPTHPSEPGAGEAFDPNHLYLHPHTFVPWLVTALFVLGLVNWPAFRHVVWRGTVGLFRSLGFVFLELPERLFKNPVVQATLNSRFVRSTLRYLVKPMVVASAAWLLLPHKSSQMARALTFAAIFLAVNLVVNSPPGLALQQAVLHAMRVGWVRFTADKLGIIIRGIVAFFARLVETVDRALYAVDEWLRFRSGGRRSITAARVALAGKAVLGIGWFYVAYVFRFALNLLVEPQINPIKHFPVVTVSHKLLLPLAIPSPGATSPMGGILVSLFGLSRGRADTIAATVVWGIPGIFGFLAWELKENWKLYRANLPSTLQPDRFGSHGESVAQLLRPGFHSGTLPKTFARLRNSYRSSEAVALAVEEGHRFPAGIHKHLVALEHAEEALHRFVNRTIVALLNRTPAFSACPIRLRKVLVGVSQIQLAFAIGSSDCHDGHQGSEGHGSNGAFDHGDGGRDLRPAGIGERDPSGRQEAAEPEIIVRIEQVSGWIVASQLDSGLLERLDETAKSQWWMAMNGFYKLAAVDVVQEDVDALFAPLQVDWQLRAKSLRVRPLQSIEVEAVYELFQETMHPSAIGEGELHFPVIRHDQLFRSAVPMRRGDWVAAWQERADRVDDQTLGA